MPDSRRSRPVPPNPGPGRRDVLATGAALAGAALFGEILASRRLRADDADPAALVPEWTRRQGQVVADPAYGAPSRYEAHVVRRPVRQVTAFSSWSFTPLQDLHGIVTPNGLVFERHHGGWPEIDPDRHHLLVHGLVERPLVFTMDDLVRFPAVSRLHFLECSGNSLTEWKGPQAPTVQESHGLLSCCEWTGVPLAAVLEEAGLGPEARWLLAEGADAAAMTRSIPIDKALDDALLVYAQNGEALRPQQGYPLRLFLPGFEGNMSIKWLRRIEVGKAPFQTREETAKYTDLMPDGTARQFTFVMEVKSVITFPSGGQSLRQKGFYEIRGLAWSGRGKIRRVEVSIDGGGSWREASLDEPVLPRCLTRFRLPWRWEGAPAALASRAVDETGAVQPTREQLVAARGTSSVYHYNGIQSWRVASSGEVTRA